MTTFIKLDALDHDIVERLSADPQITNKALAEAIGAAELQVGQRIRAMYEAKVIRVIGQRDIYSDGYTFLCFIEISIDGDVDEAADAITALPGVISVSRYLGCPQLFVNVRAKDRYQFAEFLDIQLSAVSGVQSLTSRVCLNIHKFTSGYADLSDPLPVSAHQLGEGRDERIAALLVQDGRISNREIARQLDISEGSVRQRLKKLIEDKMLRLSVLRDPVHMDNLVAAVMNVKVQPNQRATVAEALCSLGSASFVGHVSGDHNIIVLLQAESLQEIENLSEVVFASYRHDVEYTLTPILKNYLHRYDLVRIS